MKAVINYSIELELYNINYPLVFRVAKRAFITSFRGINTLSTKHLAKIISWILIYNDRMTLCITPLFGIPFEIKIVKNYKGVELYHLDNLIHTTSILFISDIEKIKFDLDYVLKYFFKI